jgi:hypothetical protein
MKKGIKLFGEAGIEAVLKELKQLHDCKVLEPTSATTMSREDKKAALQYLMFLKKKRTGTIKGSGSAPLFLSIQKDTFAKNSNSISFLEHDSVRAEIAESYSESQAHVKDAIYNVHDPIKVANAQTHLTVKQCEDLEILLLFLLNAAFYSLVVLAAI